MERAWFPVPWESFPGCNIWLLKALLKGELRISTLNKGARV